MAILKSRIFLPRYQQLHHTVLVAECMHVGYSSGCCTVGCCLLSCSRGGPQVLAHQIVDAGLATGLTALSGPATTLNVLIGRGLGRKAAAAACIGRFPVASQFSASAADGSTKVGSSPCRGAHTLRVAPLRVAPLRVAPLRVAPLRVAPLE